VNPDAFVGSWIGSRIASLCDTRLQRSGFRELAQTRPAGWAV